MGGDTTGPDPACMAMAPDRVNVASVQFCEAGGGALRPMLLWRLCELSGQDPLETVAQAAAEAGEAVTPARSLAHALNVARRARCRGSATQASVRIAPGRAA